MTGRRIKTRIFAAFLMIFAFLYLSCVAIADGEPKFTIDIESLNLTEGASTTLTITMTNAKGAKLSDITGDFVMAHIETISSTKIVNGVPTYIEESSYVIIPYVAGRFTVQGDVEYNGKTYRTNKLEMNVTDNYISDHQSKDLFVKMEFSDDEIYVGQKLVLAYDLYSKYEVERSYIMYDISISDSIIDEVPEEMLKSDTVIVEGNTYTKYEVGRIVLTPLKSGTFIIPDNEVHASVNTGGYFDDSQLMFFETAERELTVIPLPMEGQPLDFSGVVGKLEIDAQYSSTEVSYGDSLTLLVTVSGNCSLNNLRKILKEDIPGFTVYQTEVKHEESVDGYQYKAEKQFEILLVPKINGEISIDPVSISYFDPETASYETANIPGAVITVNGSAESAQTRPDGKNDDGAPDGEMPDGTGTYDTISSNNIIRIEQISYMPQNDGYLTVMLKTEYIYIGLVLLAALLGVAGLVHLAVRYVRNRDNKLRTLYKKLLRSKDENEIYGLFSSIVSQCFGVSLKASPRSMISSSISDTRLVAPILEIVDYMENKRYYANTPNINLKAKIKRVYRGLK